MDDAAKGAWLISAALLFTFDRFAYHRETLTRDYMMHLCKRWTLAVVVVGMFGVTAFAQDALLPDVRAQVDGGIALILEHYGTPSASIAIVKDGKIAYAHAYGSAQLEPKVPATAEMRYAIGSVSKQFTATAVLLLAEDGKLSLDDKVGKWLPDLTRANEVTIRQLLSMTAGYQDYWPQDYVFPRMRQPIEPREIVADWAHKPLDFEPGTRWQYSNTNYIAAGQIVEKASGMGLVEFLHKRIFDPLKMTSVFDTDQAPLPGGEPARYRRFALGPVREAPKEGAGWIYAAGELAMTPSDLARWDISMIDQTVLKPASYKIMQTEMHLTDGTATHYGLGVQTAITNGHRTVRHNGEISGFMATNIIFPDDHAAVVVLANLDASPSAADIATMLTQIVLSGPQSATRPADASTRQAVAIFEAIQHGRIDRSLFSDNANDYFSEEALKDFASSLGPLGKPLAFTAEGQSLRGGMTLRHYTIQVPGRTLHLSVYVLNDGKIEQFMVN